MDYGQWHAGTTGPPHPATPDAMTRKTDLPPRLFARLCFIQEHLRQWAEDECNGRIQRDDYGAPCHYRPDRWGDFTILVGPMPDLETRYLAEAKDIARQIGGHVYHQTDPRGCTLYFYRASDLVGHSGPIDSIYSTVALPCC